MAQSPAPLRCLTVVAAATGLLAALTAFLLPDLDAVVAPRAGGLATAPFQQLLVRGCAVAALLAATWMWAGTCLVALRAVRGRDAAMTRVVPAAVRRVVLVACGVALAGAATVPAGAAPGTPGGIAGLPYPDRATGPASAVGTSPVARWAQTGRPGQSDSAPGVVVVRAGDTLWDLAARLLPPGAGATEVTRCWRRIHELNRDVIGDDPDLIRPGQRLRLPRR